MKTPSPALPAEFVAWIRAYVLSAQFTNVRRLHRGLILRWMAWQDGINQNAIPGYTKPPKPTLNGFPAGWSVSSFTAIAKEAIGTDRIHAARQQAAATGTRYDCGSGQDYGICKACGHGHGHILKSSSLTSSH